jgi:tetratricopeptide (TPR) repeat protein
MAVRTLAEGVDLGDPYVGSRPFGRDDVRRFFGRAREARELAGLWPAHRLTVLHGATSVGKTSILRAGVLPLLERASAEILPPGRVTHGMTFPVAAIPDQNPYTFALLASWCLAEAATELSGLSVADFLRRRGEPRDHYGQPVPLLVAIDQAEELFVNPDQPDHPDHPDQQRAAFIDELAEALDEHPQLRLLLAIREDSVPDLDPYLEDLGRGSAAWFAVPPLSPAAAVEAVKGPLEATDRSFVPGVAEELVEALRTTEIVSASGDATTVVAADVEPALLQIVCSRLWESLPETARDLTSWDFGANAGIDHVLAEHCNLAISAIANDHDRSLKELRSWFQGVFGAEAGGEEAHEGAHETAGMPNAVVRAFENHRVLRAARRDGARIYRLLADRLIPPVRLIGALPPRPPLRLGAAAELRVAEDALTDGELWLAERHADLALRRAADEDLRLRASAQALLGNVAHRRGNPADAETHYRAAATLYEVLQDTASVARLLAAAGQSLLRQGRLSEAVDELRAAVERSPKDLAIQTELGQALWRLGQQRAAVEVLTGVLNLDGDSSKALQARGEILADLGEAKEAIRDLTRVRRRQAPTRAALGLALATLHDLGAATKEIDSALREAPDSGPVLLRAARIGRLRGDSATAADFARRAAADPALPPHQREAALRLAASRSA